MEFHCTTMPKYIWIRLKAEKAALGLFCGGAGQLLANPFDLVKGTDSENHWKFSKFFELFPNQTQVQMQAEGKRIMQGYPPRVASHTFTWLLLWMSLKADKKLTSGLTYKLRSKLVVGERCGPDAGPMCNARHSSILATWQRMIQQKWVLWRHEITPKYVEKMIL